MRAVVKAAIVFVVFIMTAPDGVRAEEPLRFEPDVVTISGRHLTSFVILGDGEMRDASILYLEGPITIQGNPDSANSKRTVNDVDRILLDPQDGVSFENLAGRDVTVKGRLFHEPSEIFHTEVLMKVDELIGAVE